MMQPLPPLLTALAADLFADAGGAAFISAYVLVLFVGAEILSRWLALPVEWTRKLTHLGAGGIVLAFPGSWRTR